MSIKVIMDIFKCLNMERKAFKNVRITAGVFNNRFAIP